MHFSVCRLANLEKFTFAAVLPSVLSATKITKTLPSAKQAETAWLGVRPANRGVVMNPNDHPHGGGEGKAPVGRKRPVTPWGKPAYGVKTRHSRKASTKLIVKRRK